MTKRRIVWIILIISLAVPCTARGIQPEDLEYQGAFRLPDSPSAPDNVGWAWNGWASALTFFPDGDPDGPDDGTPGSLFGVGHDHTQYVSEISIPVPMISPSKNLEDLNTAETLQAFRDIQGGLFGYMEMPRVGLAYLEPQAGQTTGKLYFAWAPHLDEGGTRASHGWCETDLSDPRPAGPWRIGEYWNYVTGDYIFPVPKEWADAHTPGNRLITGRFRDGGQGAMGPSLFAIAPWNAGNPPASGATIPAIPLLLYGNVYEDNPPSMTGYHHSDEWSGGVWVTDGENSAVVFVGTKGQGDCWYGCADGTDEPPWPEDCNRGWWSTGFVAQMRFYDAEDLAAVARGEMESWKPQPYASLDIDEVLYHVESGQQWQHVGAAAFDTESGLLYVFEPRADEDKSLVHVWKLNPRDTGVEAKRPDRHFTRLRNYPNPFNASTTIAFSLPESQQVVLTIYNIEGRQMEILFDARLPSGDHRIGWECSRYVSGTYFLELAAGGRKQVLKMHLIK